MGNTRINFAAIAIGVVLTLFALVNSIVTIATGHGHANSHRGVLLTALISELLALGFLAVPFNRGPLGWRIAAIVLASPALFVFSDFLQRFFGR